MGFLKIKRLKKNVPEEQAVYFITEKFETGKTLLGILLKQIGHLDRKDEKRAI